MTAPIRPTGMRGRPFTLKQHQKMAEAAKILFHLYTELQESVLSRQWWQVYSQHADVAARVAIFEKRHGRPLSESEIRKLEDEA